MRDQDTTLGLLSFGVAELTKYFKDERDIIVRNHDKFPGDLHGDSDFVGRRAAYG